MERALASGDGVGLPGAQREEVSAVLQHEAGACRREPGPEAGVVALDQRDDVPLAVHHGQVDGVASPRGGDAGKLRGLDVAGGFLRVDQPRPRRRVLLGKKLLHRNAGEARIADVPEQVGVGELLRLDHRVQRARRVKAPLADGELLEDVEHLQRGDALAVGRQLADLPAAVGGLDGLHPLGLELRQVLGRHHAAAFAHHGHDCLRRRTLVEAVATLLRDSPERPRQVGVAERLASPRRLSPNQERRPRLGIVRQHLDRMRPQLGGHLHHRKAVLGVPDGRCEIGRQREPAEALVQGRPAGHRPGDGHRVDPAVRQLTLDSLAFQKLERHSCRGPAARVHPVELVLLRQVDDGEEVAADAVRGGLHQPLGGIGGDRGVHRAPAALEDLRRGLRRQGLARGRDPVLRGGDRTAGDGQSGNQAHREGHHGALLPPLG